MVASEVEIAPEYRAAQSERRQSRLRPFSLPRVLLGCLHVSRRLAVIDEAERLICKERSFFRDWFAFL